MFSKKTKSRPQSVRREKIIEEEEERIMISEDTSLEDLIAFRKFKKGRQGINIDNVSLGGQKGEKRPRDENGSKGGMSLPAVESRYKSGDDQVSDEESAKTRKSVRTNNFTQQTNTQDVDKHMMAYIEEQMKKRHQNNQNQENTEPHYLDPKEELYRITTTQKKLEKPAEEGSVSNSMKMLTAIPEVDLGMDTRLKNIEDTEKAKRSAAEARLQASANRSKEDEYTGPARFAAPHNKEAPTATDELVMERFKKRMRR